MLTGWIIAALIALGTWAAITIAAWTIVAVASWVYDAFKQKSPDVKTGISIPASAIGPIIGGVAKEDEELGNRLKEAFFGDAEPKKMMVWQNENGAITEINALKAQDASVDELGNTIHRFERDGRIMEY